VTNLSSLLQISGLHPDKQTKNYNISWVDRMNSFLISDNCPIFLKADVEKAKQNFNVDNLDDPVENQFENEMPQQPD
jgi:thymidylate kinase